MYDLKLALTILHQIDRALQTIQRRFAPVTSILIWMQKSSLGFVRSAFLR